MIFSCILWTVNSSTIYRSDATLPPARSFDPRHVTYMNRLLFVNEALVHRSYTAVFLVRQRWVCIRYFKTPQTWIFSPIIFPTFCWQASGVHCLPFQDELCKRGNRCEGRGLHRRIAVGQEVRKVWRSRSGEEAMELGLFAWQWEIPSGSRSKKKSLSQAQRSSKKLYHPLVCGLRSRNAALNQI